MAKSIVLTDDVTGETLTEGTPTTTVTISDPRNEYPPFEIDLSDTSLKALLKSVEKYRLKGRAVTERQSLRKSITDDDAARKFAQEARAWAIAHNVQPTVSDRGAVPQRALDAYREHLARQDVEDEVRAVVGTFPDAMPNNGAIES